MRKAQANFIWLGIARESNSNRKAFIKQLTNLKSWSLYDDQMSDPCGVRYSLPFIFPTPRPDTAAKVTGGAPKGRRNWEKDAE